jgi:hypothetical protein
MSTLVGILAFAALFGLFAYMGPVLLKKMRCGGKSCGSCRGSTCETTE